MQADVGIGQGLGQFDLFACCQWMVERGDQNQLIGAEMDDLQAICLDRPGDDAQVGGAVHHAAHDVTTESLLKVDGNARSFSEKPGKDFRQEFGRGRGIGEDLDMPAGFGSVLGELVFHVVHLAHDHPRMVQKPLACGCQFYTPAVTV